jgi:hypothetical protein
LYLIFEMPLNIAPSCQQPYDEIDGEVYVRYEDGLLVVHPVEVRDALGTLAERPGARVIAQFSRNGLKEGIYDSRILDTLKAVARDPHTNAETSSFPGMYFNSVRDQLAILFRNVFRQ